MFTDQTITTTRQRFADNAIACIDEVKSGAVKVNDPEAYFAWRGQQVLDALAGKDDHTFTFRQYAHFIQTGECVALLA